jgi:hypothetical protein
LPVGSAP